MGHIRVDDEVRFGPRNGGDVFYSSDINVALSVGISLLKFRNMVKVHIVSFRKTLY